MFAISSATGLLVLVGLAIALLLVGVYVGLLLRPRLDRAMPEYRDSRSCVSGSGLLKGGRFFLLTGYVKRYNWPGFYKIAAK